MAGGREIALLLPAAVALDLIPCVEAVALEQAVSETERHRGVIAPGAAGEIEGTAAEHVTYRGEGARATVLSRGRDGVAYREAE